MEKEDLKSLIYVSRRAAFGFDGQADLEEILTVARERNKLLRVTGALISTSEHFAQYIEGPNASVARLMESINKDDRHKDIKVLMVKSDIQRKFAKWAMAYSRDEVYVDKHLNRLLKPLTSEILAEQVTQLEDFMEEFSKRLA